MSCQDDATGVSNDTLSFILFETAKLISRVSFPKDKLRVIDLDDLVQTVIER